MSEPTTTELKPPVKCVSYTRPVPVFFTADEYNKLAPLCREHECLSDVVRRLLVWP